MAKFGPFTTDLYESISAYQRAKENLGPDAVIEYRKIDSPLEKMWNELSSIALLDARTLLKNHTHEVKSFVLFAKNDFANCDSSINLPIEHLFPPETDMGYDIACFVLNWMSDNIPVGYAYDCDLYIPENEKFENCLVLSLEACGGKPDKIDNHPTNMITRLVHLNTYKTLEKYFTIEEMNNAINPNIKQRIQYF
jgi:hypothetical protein